jgi:hypothetical protein
MTVETRPDNHHGPVLPVPNNQLLSSWVYYLEFYKPPLVGSVVLFLNYVDYKKKLAIFFKENLEN